MSNRMEDKKMLNHVKAVLREWVAYHEGASREPHPVETCKLANRYREYQIAKRIYG